MKIAVCAYRPEWHEHWKGLVSKLEACVAKAAQNGAELLVFPEYAGMEASLIGSVDAALSARDWTARAAKRWDDWVNVHVRLAGAHGVHVLAGSMPRETDAGMVNSAAFCSPGGAVVVQDKCILTPYERAEMGLTPGSELRLIESDLGRIGVLICYDAEFPLLARQLAEAGAEMLLVPSCTDFPAGQTRVRQSARARAIEQQCLVVQAPLVGTVSGCDVVDRQTGRTGVFAPPDHGLPPDGILAQGELDVPGWTFYDVDLAAIMSPRRSGQVGNFGHWNEQSGHMVRVVKAVPGG